MGSPVLGKDSLFLTRRIHVKPFSSFPVIRGELGGTRASPMGPLRLHQPAAASAGKEMVWQSTSKGTGIAFIAST